MSDILKELEELGEDIETAKREKAKEEGRLDEMKRSLKSEFKVDSLTDAEEELTRMENDLNDLDQEIQEDYSKLKANYDWE